MLNISQAMTAATPPMIVDMINERPVSREASLVACCPIDATFNMTGTYATLAAENNISKCLDFFCVVIAGVVVSFFNHDEGFTA